MIPGHEVIGTVVAVGEGEKKWKEGDRVGGAWHGGHDGLCKSCNKGLFQMCENEAINGVTMNGGCKSEMPFISTRSCTNPVPRQTQSIVSSAPKLRYESLQMSIQSHMLRCCAPALPPSTVFEK